MLLGDGQINFGRVLSIRYGFRVGILKPSLFHLSIVEEINKFSNKLCFILSEECNENFYSGMTELI